jgi:hypothetical protein
MSTDKKSVFVDAKELSECNAMANRKRKKMINSGLKKIHRKLKIEQHKSHLKPGRNSVGDNLSL